jgi:hypothetical protein
MTREAFTVSYCIVSLLRYYTLSSVVRPCYDAPMPRVDDILAYDGTWLCGNGHDMTDNSNWIDYIDELGNELVRCRACKLIGDRRSRAKRKVKGKYKRDGVRVLEVDECRGISIAHALTFSASDYVTELSSLTGESTPSVP